MFNKKRLGIMILVMLLTASVAWASTGSAESTSVGHGNFAIVFLEIGLILIGARVVASLSEKLGQPGVLGELLLGIVLGNLPLIGFGFLSSLQTDQFLAFLAQLGVVILLFQVGLESNIKEMMKVGVPAFLVASVGVIVPFVLGTWIFGPWLLPGLDFKAYLFIGAALTATSVSITARVFHDLSRTESNEAKIVLGAAVIDDVMGLIILAAVSAIAIKGTVSAGEVIIVNAKAIGFLVAAIVLGQLFAPRLSWLFSRISDSHGMKFTVAVTFGLVLAFAAQEIGLAAIVGAFAAGLILDPVHFRRFQRPDIVCRLEDALDCKEVPVHEDLAERITEAAKDHSEEHVERLIRPLGYFLVPIFFVMVGVSVKLDILFDPKILLTALGITAIAFLGKIVAGLAAGKKANKLIVGVGMIPRGEVGLIFAVMGQSLGVVTPEVYAIIVVVVALSTLITPSLLVYLLKRQSPVRVVEAEAEA